MPHNDQHLLSRENTQWIQGAAALKIMVFHFLMQTEYYPRIFNILSFTVTVFIFISGFGLNESYKKNGLAGYWRKRILRVFIPCWIVFLFRIPFVESFDATQLIKNLLFTGSELWFMDFIIRWYIVYWLARKFFPKHTTAILLAYSFVNIFKEQFMSQQAFTFLLGYLASKHYDKIRQWNKAKVLKITICSVLYASAFTLLKTYPPHTGIYRYSTVQPYPAKHTVSIRNNDYRHSVPAAVGKENPRYQLVRQGELRDIHSPFHIHAIRYRIAVNLHIFGVLNSHQRSLLQNQHYA